jgi:hypothetical protein
MTAEEQLIEMLIDKPGPRRETRSRVKTPRPSYWLKHVVWDNIPEHYALGWRIEPDQMIRRGEHSCIMVWPHEGEPKMPVRE